nr:MAG TPA: hypothetical protein [Caudoviricetes sp.]
MLCNITMPFGAVMTAAAALSGLQSISLQGTDCFSKLFF